MTEQPKMDVPTIYIVMDGKGEPHSPLVMIQNCKEGELKTIVASDDITSAVLIKRSAVEGDYPDAYIVKAEIIIDEVL